ncbi:MAG: hypothetical protein Q9168_003828 [Polycauliona sp. 1 TL-2023]
MSAASQSGLFKPPNDLDDVLQRIDVFAKKSNALMQSNKDDHVRKCIRQLEEQGTRIREEVAKDPRDDELLSGCIKDYCDLENFVNRITSVDDSAQELIRGSFGRGQVPR